MQIDEIIARVDSLEPNQYEKETKLSWISQLDGKIFAEIILTHDGSTSNRPTLQPWLA